MSFFRPKDKFEVYFNSIGTLLYLIILCAAILFLVGFSFYELYFGNYKWLKKNPAIIFVFIMIAGIATALLKNRKKR
jgi:hypothetical protein